MKIYLPVALLLCMILLFSCSNKKGQQVDHPAYHNPAVRELTDAIAAHPGEAQFYFQRSVALSQINEDSLALIDLYKAVSIDSNNAGYYSAVGYVELNLNHPENAIKAFQKSIAIHPAEVRTHLDLADAYIKAKKMEDATNVIENVLRKAPQYPPALLAMAKLHAASKDTSRAIATLKDVLKLQPNYYDASMQLADYYNDRQNPEAITQYQKTFALDSSDASPLFEIGRYYQQQRDLERAKQYYIKCFLLDKEYTYAYINIGRILVEQDSLEKAIRHYRLALQVAPNNKDAWFLAGQVFAKMNRPDSAKYYFHEALLFGYDEKEVMKAQKELK